MMITRSKQYGTTTIDATFSWDEGASAGIRSGFGEDTGVIITTLIGDNRLDTHITFAIEDEDGFKWTEPAEWAIDSVQTTWVVQGRLAGRITLASGQRWPTTPAVVRLSDLPEVLEVVADAWAAWKAAERLSVAQENVDEMQAYELELQTAAREANRAYQPGLGRTQRLELMQVREELTQALAELEAAKDEAKQRGVIQ